MALSLILSLLLFKPAPVYILDEVDAALDLSHTQVHSIRTSSESGCPKALSILIVEYRSDVEEPFSQFAVHRCFSEGRYVQ